MRKYYLKDPGKHGERRARNTARYRQRNRAYVTEYLRTYPCVDCGESDPVVLEFDHVKTKRRNVADLAHVATPVSTLQLEIEQCVVRCANCHRRRTARQFGWQK